VDRETGQVKVLNVVTAHEVGTVINPLAHQGQIDGGFVTGLGLAVTEELVSEGGQLLNGHFVEYKLPTIADNPSATRSIALASGGAGPYRSEAHWGAGQQRCGAAAIVDAVARRVRCPSCSELPITAERVYTRLSTGENLRTPDGTNRHGAKEQRAPQHLASRHLPGTGTAGHATPGHMG
jgi:CO/xanthine dehydrogenase Mo-binding subunit